MKVFKHIINWTVWTLVGLYAVVMMAVRTPAVQEELGARLSQMAGQSLGTSVRVGRVDLGFLNRLILDDIIIYDQQRKQMVKVSRMTAKLDLAQIAMGRIAVSSAQVFGASLTLYKPAHDAQANFQFVIDSLASNDTTTSMPLNLNVNSFIMRNSTVAYNEWDAPQTPGRLNPRHLHIANISAHINLKKLTDDSLNINVKRLTFMEQSGLNVKRLGFRLAAGRRTAILKDFQLQLPATRIHLDSLYASYDMDHFDQTLHFGGHIADTHIHPSDLTSLVPQLHSYRHTLTVDAGFDYTDNTLSIHRLHVDDGHGSLALTANGTARRSPYGRHTWLLNVDHLNVAGETIGFVSANIAKLPDEVLRLGNVQLKGTFGGDTEGTLHAQAEVTTDAGSADMQLQLKSDRQLTGHLTTEGIDAGLLSGNSRLGIVAASMDVSGSRDHIAAKGSVDKLEYEGYTYTGITVDGSYSAGQYAGWLQIDDPKVGARLEVDLEANTLNDAVGVVSLHNLSLPEKDYRLNFLRLESGFDDGRHFLVLKSDFAHANLSGDFDYSTLAQSVANAVGSKLPTLPGLPAYRPSSNNFALNLTMGKTDWLQKLFGVELDITQPVSLTATVNDPMRQITVDLQAPSFTYGDSRYQDGSLHVTSPADSLSFRAALSSCPSEGQPFDFNVSGYAADNNLTAAIGWDNNHPEKPLSGTLNLTSHFYRNYDDADEAHVSILPSNVYIDNSVWMIEPSDLLYSTKRLLIDHFAVHNGRQYITVDGTASRQSNDSVAVRLDGVEVAYILELVGFDAVAFAGQASGTATISSVFSEPDAHANLKVDHFTFENGRMGTLTAHVDWNKADQQIDIRATANDGPEATTYINGYVSPEKDFIDLAITARGSYLDFMHTYTESFISHITGNGNGELRLAGPLSAINLTGQLVVDGQATITPLNTTYTLKQDTVTMVYNEIQLNRLPIYDKYNNVAYLSGAIRHQDLTNLSLDLHVDTAELLAYDFHDFGDNSFYGTVLASGSVDISMKGNDVHIDCDVTPLKNTVFVYNAANPDAISDQEFITWQSQPTGHQKTGHTDEPQDDSNIYMSFHVNVIPDATLRLLMDAQTNDYINLGGSGALQATYYNKGAFNMFGTYTVDHGTYDITIQNIIKKNFQFQSGGTIVFGGDPYSAALNLQAQYTVNGVSLSDLQLGNSFSSNTVRVVCLMNIGGQPSAPQVTFDLDMPNVNSDEKQMVRSLLSSQQEMNQQVLYLLGIGRFYSQGQNNANQQQQDQTSLAMQSFLSGTLSSQINSVINQFVKNDDWNFGANISTGTEGWNNAEYEGIVNGRMLNNRLLINGQFGYRDNATQASPSFIGDFDVRYLLFPNGNMALKVYNQTNDRYFTRSSLNTQGVGIIMKKDFNGFHDFMGIRRKKPLPDPSPAATPPKDTLSTNTKPEENE